jgi:Fic family protein
MKHMIPPFKITPAIFSKSQGISRELGVLLGQKIANAPFKLRKTNNIKTIQASLAIEGNTLTLDQVTDLFEGKRVVGPAKDILETKNALKVYEDLKAFDPLMVDDLLKAHGLLMSDLVFENGQWRTGNVGVFKGQEIAHMAPPAKRVSALMDDLFHFIKENQDVSWLLKACIFHYEFEFIHPFSDGNGRMGRLWQQLLLMKEDPVFEFIPIEVAIKNNQNAYYDALGEADALGESTPFIEFSLEMIYQALVDYKKTANPQPMDAFARLTYARALLPQDGFSRKDYLLVHKDMSTATASRDLTFGIQQGLLSAVGNKNQIRYFFTSI